MIMPKATPKAASALTHATWVLFVPAPLCSPGADPSVGDAVAPTTCVEASPPTTVLAVTVLCEPSGRVEVDRTVSVSGAVGAAVVVSSTVVVATDSVAITIAVSESSVAVTSWLEVETEVRMLGTVVSVVGVVRVLVGVVRVLVLVLVVGEFVVVVWRGVDVVVRVVLTDGGVVVDVCVVVRAGVVVLVRVVMTGTVTVPLEVLISWRLTIASRAATVAAAASSSELKEEWVTTSWANLGKAGR